MERGAARAYLLRVVRRGAHVAVVALWSANTRTRQTSRQARSMGEQDADTHSSFFCDAHRGRGDRSGDAVARAGRRDGDYLAGREHALEGDADRDHAQDGRPLVAEDGRAYLVVGRTQVRDGAWLRRGPWEGTWEGATYVAVGVDVLWTPARGPCDGQISKPRSEAKQRQYNKRAGAYGMHGGLVLVVHHELDSRGRDRVLRVEPELERERLALMRGSGQGGCGAGRGKASGETPSARSGREKGARETRARRAPRIRSRRGPRARAATSQSRRPGGERCL